MNRSRIAAFPFLFALLGGPLLLAAPSWAEVLSGDRCRLSTELNVELRSGRGWVEVPLPKGSAVDVIAVVDATARVRGDNIEGRVETARLEEACTKPQVRCELYKPLEVQEKRTLDGRAWRVNPGAQVSILKEDQTFYEVKVGKLRGFADRAGFWKKCERQAAVEVFADEAASETRITYQGFPLADLPAPKRIALVPFVTGPGVDSNRAVLFEDQLEQGVLNLRRDTQAFESPRRTAPTRRSSLKPHLQHLFKAGQATNVAYIITGELKKVPHDKAESIEDPDETEADRHARLLEAPGTYVLVVAVIDVGNRKVLKTLRTKPTLQAGDNWSKGVAGAMNSVLPVGGRK